VKLTCAGKVPILDTFTATTDIHFAILNSSYKYVIAAITKQMVYRKRPGGKALYGWRKSFIKVTKVNPLYTHSTFESKQVIIYKHSTFINTLPL
jgi:hypothetical protein